LKRFFICTDSATGLKPGVNEIKFPIPTVPTAERSALSGLGILAAKRTGDAVTVTALESEIASQPRKVFPEKLPVAVATGGDTHVFRLYALTPAEIELVKASAQK
jgi:hypothetical protein